MNRSGTVGVGVIGLGAVSDAHLAGLRSVDGAHVRAVCDLDAQRARAVAEEHGARAYSDWRELLADGTVDAVLVLLPHALHQPVATAALEAGKHVCVEKPMALDAAQCEQLCELAEARGLTLAVAENSRFADAYIAAHRRLAGGDLGRIRLVRAFVHGSAVPNYRRSDAGWRIEPGGIGAVIDAAPHHLQLLRWFFGDVESVQATTRHWVRDELLPQLAVEDGALLSGRLATGGHWSIEISLSAELPWGERLELHGERGSLVVDQLAPAPVRFHAGGDDLEGTSDPGVPYDPLGWQPRSIAAAAADFAIAVRDGRDPLVSGRDGAWTLRVIDAAYASAAADGVRVDLTAAR